MTFCYSFLLTHAKDLKLMARGTLQPGVGSQPWKKIEIRRDILKQRVLVFLKFFHRF